MIRIQPIDMTKAREEKQTAWKPLVLQAHIHSDKAKPRKRASYNVRTNRTKNFLTLFRTSLFPFFEPEKGVLSFEKKNKSFFLSHIENIVVYLPAVNSRKKIECSIKNNFKQ